MRRYTARITWIADDRADVTYRVELHAGSFAEAAKEAERRADQIGEHIHGTPNVVSLTAHPHEEHNHEHE